LDASVDPTEAPYRPIGNSMLEDALRPVAMGRTRYLHPEIGREGRTATVTMSLVSPGRGPGNAPLADFHDMLNRVNTHPAGRVDDLSPDRRGLPGGWMDDGSEGRGRRTPEAKPQSEGGPQ
jgi:hypothetical protein